MFDRWPWSRRRAEPVAATSTAPERPVGQWRDVPALQRNPEPMAEIAPLDVFVGSLATSRDPSMITPLYRMVDDGPMTYLPGTRPAPDRPASAPPAVVRPRSFPVQRAAAGTWIGPADVSRDELPPAPPDPAYPVADEMVPVAAAPAPMVTAPAPPSDRTIPVVRSSVPVPPPIVGRSASVPRTVQRAAEAPHPPEPPEPVAPLPVADREIGGEIAGAPGDPIVPESPQPTVSPTPTVSPALTASVQRAEVAGADRAPEPTVRSVEPAVTAHRVPSIATATRRGTTSLALQRSVGGDPAIAALPEPAVQADPAGLVEPGRPAPAVPTTSRPGGVATEADPGPRPLDPIGPAVGEPVVREMSGPIDPRTIPPVVTVRATHTSRSVVQRRTDDESMIAARPIPTVRLDRSERSEADESARPAEPASEFGVPAPAARPVDPIDPAPTAPVVPPFDPSPGTATGLSGAEPSVSPAPEPVVAVMRSVQRTPTPDHPGSPIGARPVVAQPSPVEPALTVGRDEVVPVSLSPIAPADQAPARAHPAVQPGPEIRSSAEAGLGAPEGPWSVRLQRAATTSATSAVPPGAVRLASVQVGRGTAPFAADHGVAQLGSEPDRPEPGRSESAAGPPVSHSPVPRSVAVQPVADLPVQRRATARPAVDLPVQRSDTAQPDADPPVQRRAVASPLADLSVRGAGWPGSAGTNVPVPPGFPLPPPPPASLQRLPESGAGSTRPGIGAPIADIPVTARGAEPGRTMSLQQMFAGIAREVVEPTSGTPDSPTVQRKPGQADTETAPPVQREPASTPAAEPAPTAAASSTSAGGSAPAGATAAPLATPAAPNLDELANRLYEPIAARMKAELWLDRERAGLLTDPRGC